MRWTVGDVEITKITELELSAGISRMIPGATPEKVRAVPWLRPHFATADGGLRASIHALVVRTPSMRIVVDTGVGNGKRGEPEAAWDGLRTGFPADLAAAGHPPDQVDLVVCTHAHPDHIGWHTTYSAGAWRPTFPNARHVFVAEEFEHARTATEHNGRLRFEESLRPLLAAGLVDLVAPGSTLAPEVRLSPSPGHTVGHTSVDISSRGERAFITGDAVHHPIHFRHPELASGGDHDEDRAAATRRALLSRLAREEVLVIGTHFASPTAGYAVADGDALRFVPADDGPR
jgi:glyoxylase-like metal-dependent hydrolase (beta-lactamase superfamily II)